MNIRLHHFIPLLLAAVFIAMPKAHAATVGKNSQFGITKTTGTTGTAGVKGGGSDFENLLKGPVGGGGGGGGPGDATFEALLKLPFTPKDFPADAASVKGLVTAKNLAKALRGGVGAYVAGEAIAALMKEACVRGMGGSLVMNESATFEECLPKPAIGQSDGYRYYLSATIPLGPFQYHATPAQACTFFKEKAEASFKLNNSSATVIGSEVTECTASANGTARARVRWKIGAGAENYSDYAASLYRESTTQCPAGWYVHPTTNVCTQEKPVLPDTYQTSSHAQVEAKLEEALKLPANAGKAEDAIKEMLRKGGTVEINAPTITGPAASPVSTSTTSTVTGGQTQTTTTTTQTTYTYAGPNVTAKEITTTTTRNAAGEVVSTSTTESTPAGEPPAAPGDPAPPESEPEEPPPTDTPLPEIPTLYERKYPEGMEGVWNEQKAALLNSPLMQLKDSLLPSLGSSGSCPTLPVDFTYATWASFGVHDVAPPCWVWDFGKVVIILSAMFLARALIFGG